MTNILHECKCSKYTVKSPPSRSDTIGSGEPPKGWKSVNSASSKQKKAHTRSCLIIAPSPIVEKNFLAFTGGAIIRNHVFVKNKAICFCGNFFSLFLRGGQLLGGAIIRQLRVHCVRFFPPPPREYSDQAPLSSKKKKIDSMM